MARTGSGPHSTDSRSPSTCCHRIYPGFSPQANADYAYLNGSGSLVKLNGGIEFAAIYFTMLLALAIIGGGRYLSLDDWLDRILRRFG